MYVLHDVYELVIKMKAIKVDTRGMHEVLKDVSLKGLQEAVGGYVEAVYLRVEPFEYVGNK